MNRLPMNLYDRLPIFFQDVAVSMHGLRLKCREYGREFERMLGQFEAQQWFSESEMEVYQNEQLRAIVNHAYHNVPYYRHHYDNYHLAPSDVRTVADIHKIPPIETEVLVDHAKEMISATAENRDKIIGHTSGTTGRSKAIFYDRRVCRVKNIVDWRLKRIGGIDVGHPLAFFVGRQVVSIKQKMPPFWRKNWFQNSLYFSAFHFSPLWYDAYIDALHDFDASAMDGYPSTVSMFGEALLSRNRSHRLKAAFVSSEILLPHQRRAIEKGFNCPVFDYYGMAERAVFASECEKHRGLHLNADFGLCELLDDMNYPVSPGTSGRVVVTGWHNYTMPFIRYKTNDWATLSLERCTCGRPFPLLASIDGRQEDQVATTDGRYLDVSFTYETFKVVQSRIVQSQIVQEESGEVIIHIIPTVDFSKADADFLIKGIGRYMGPGACVRVNICDSIPSEKSGKYRWLISKVPRRIV